MHAIRHAALETSIQVSHQSLRYWHCQSDHACDAQAGTQYCSCALLEVPNVQLQQHHSHRSCRLKGLTSKGSQLPQPALCPVAVDDDPRRIHKALSDLDSLAPVIAFAEQQPLGLEALQTRVPADPLLLLLLLVTSTYRSGAAGAFEDAYGSLRFNLCRQAVLQYESPTGSQAILSDWQQ